MTATVCMPSWTFIVLLVLVGSVAGMMLNGCVQLWRTRHERRYEGAHRADSPPIVIPADDPDHGRRGD